MKKKGFTLLELLAVIVIMVIILLIFTPDVLKLINKSEINTYSVKEKLIARAGEDYALLSKIKLPSGEGQEKLIDIETLVDSNFITKVYDLTNKDKACLGYLVIKKNTTYGHDYKACLFCENYETTDNDCHIDRMETIGVEVPILLLYNNNPYYLEIGSTYTDPGCAAYDVDGSNITDRVVTTGLPINTNNIGINTVTYNVQNVGGVSALPITRQVVVRDTTPPVVAFGASGNATPSKMHSTTVTATDLAEISELKYLWSTSATTPSDVLFTNSFTNGATISSPASLNGSYYLWIYAKDNNNNVSKIKSNTFVFDNTPPSVATATIVSNNALDNKLAKNGDTVTLSITFSEAITNTPTVTIGGRTAIVSGSGTTRTAAYAIPVGEVTLTEGSLAINISDYSDAAGNIGNVSTTITSGGAVTYDRTPPVYTYFYIGGSGNPAQISSTTTVLSFSVSGATKMCINTVSTGCGSWEDYITTKAYTLTSGEGTKTVYAWFRDDAGNQIGSYSDSIILDTGDPIVSVATIVSNNPNNKQAKNGDTVTLSITFSESIYNTPTVTIGGRTATVSGSGTTRTATYTIPAGEVTLAEGSLSINISNYEDQAGNLGSASTTITSGGAVNYDRTLPTITSTTIVSNNAVNNKQAKNGDTVTLSITFSESISNTPTVTIGGRTATLSGSGTARTATYTIPAGEATLAEGSLGISISSYNDAAGNTGSASTTITSGGAVNYDRTLPTITSATIVSNNANDKQAKNGDRLTLSITFSESISNTPTVTIGGRTATLSGSGTARTATYTIPAGEATLTEGFLGISISSYNDAAGNTGSASTTITSGGAVNYDRTLPTITSATIVSNNAVNNKQAKNGDTVTLSITFSESINNTPTVTIGGRTASISGSGTTRTATYTIPAGEATLAEGSLGISISGYSDVTDNAGSTSTTITSGGAVNYDRTLPAITSATIVSNNALDNKKATNENMLTLIIAFSESINNTPTVTIGGRTATVSGSGSTRTAIYTIPVGEATLAEGSLEISISSYNDAADNTGSTSTTITSGGAVTYDRTAPIVTYFYIGGTNNPAYVSSTSTTLYFSVSEATEMCINTTTSCSDWEDYASSKAINLVAGDETKTYYAWFRDATGNATAYSSDTITLDTTDPVFTYAYIGGTGNPYSVTSTSTTFYFSVSGATEMCVSSTTSCSAWEAYASSKAITLSAGYGTKTHYVWFRDVALNTIGYYSDAVKYLQSTHTTTYNSVASGYSYNGYNGWQVSTSTVIQGTPSSLTHLNYWGIMFFNLSTIKTKFVDYRISQIVYTIVSGGTAGTTKASDLYVGGPCPTMSGSPPTSYTIAGDGTSGNPYKPTAIGTFVTSPDPAGSYDPAVWTITNSTWINNLMSANSECVFMNKYNQTSAGFYWEGEGAKDTNPPKMVITWVPR